MSDTGRLEAFSDGVLAIAITLLVLELRVPRDLGDESLARALAHEWPSYAAYVVSFLVIGIMWVNHHSMFRLVRYVNRPVLFLNLLLLLVIAAIPFPTALMAAYLDTGDASSHTAAAVYSGVFVLAAAGFNLLWRYLVAHPHLLEPDVDLVGVRSTVRRFGIGLFVYLATVGLAFLSAPLTLAVHFVIAVYYALDQLAVRAPANTG